MLNTLVRCLRVLVAAVVVAGCTTPVDYAQPRLVILYAPCTVSRLYMSPYDDAIEYTESFERFASRATVFERHHTESGQSGLAYASLFSGGHGEVHGIFKHPAKIPQEVLLLPEVFAAAGYETYSWLFQKMAAAALDYAQGVADENAYADGPLLADDERFVRILERLRSDPSYKAFIVTNFSVTHGPYEGALLDEFCERYPADCAARGEDLDKYKELAKAEHRPLTQNYPFAVKRLGLTDYDQRRLREVNDLHYKADMYRLDRMFGAVVDAVDEAGLFDRSIIALTADHGEIHYRDNALLYWTHGYQLVPEVIHVPLMISGPAAGVGVGRYPGVTRSIDVLPTLAGLAGVEVGDDYKGKGEDLTAAVRGKGEPPDLIAFSHSALKYAPMRARTLELFSSYFPGPEPTYMWISARRGDEYFKLHRSPDDQWQVSKYDLASDPAETTDLFNDGHPRDRAMADLMGAYKVEMSEAAYNSVATGLPRREAIEMLRSLGYVD